MKERLDPEILALFDDVILAQGFPLDDIPKARAFYTKNREALGSAPETPAHLDLFVVNLETYDQASIELRIAKPKTIGPHPCILWMHGGGYVMGEARFDDALLLALADQLGAVAASVEYRLAPEFPFPTPLEDAYSALKYLSSESKSLDINPMRMAIGGASAGGGMAAALALLARDRNFQPLRGQALLYPMLDETNTNPSSYNHLKHFVWNCENNKVAWDAYVPGDKSNISPYAAPIRAKNFEGLPPAFIPTGSLDLFLDENISYARALIDAGIPAELHVFPGACHAFNGFFPTTQVAKRCNASLFDFFRRVLG